MAAITGASERAGRRRHGRRRHGHDQLRLERRHRHLVEEASRRPGRLHRRRAGADQLRRQPDHRRRADLPQLQPPRARVPRPPTTNGDGSCMLVVATDAPLDARDLRRLAARAIFGLARTGSSYSNGSGDFAIAFSTSPEMRSRFNETAPRGRTPSCRPTQRRRCSRPRSKRRRKRCTTRCSRRRPSARRSARPKRSRSTACASCLKLTRCRVPGAECRCWMPGAECRVPTETVTETDD